MQIRKFLWQLFSEDDDQAPCFGKVFGAGMIFLYQAMTVYDLFHGNIRLLEYAQGSGLVLAAVGSLIAMKQATSKEQP